MVEFDPGPSKSIANHLAALPSYAPHRDFFWYDWGPVFYRGRLNMSARLLCVASDPGPTERIACRTLIGDAGQRVQGFLSKLGLPVGSRALRRRSAVGEIDPAYTFPTREAVEHRLRREWINSGGDPTYPDQPEPGDDWKAHARKMRAGIRSRKR